MHFQNCNLLYVVKTEKLSAHKSRTGRSVFLMMRNEDFALFTFLQKAASPAEQTPQWRGRGETASWWWTSWSSWEKQPGSWETPSTWRKAITHVSVYSKTLISCTTHRNSCAYLVILNILRSLSALSTLIPNDMPGLKKPQTTSKMLPTMTCNKNQFHESQ